MKKSKVMYIISIILTSISFILSSILLLSIMEIDDLLSNFENIDESSSDGFSVIIFSVVYFLLAIFVIGSSLLCAVLVIIFSIPSIVISIINIINKYKRIPSIILLSINSVLLIFSLYCLCV